MNAKENKAEIHPGQVLADPSGIYLLIDHLVIPGLYDVTEYHLDARSGTVVARAGQTHRGVDEGCLAKLKPAPAPVAEAVLDKDVYRRAYDAEFEKRDKSVCPEEMCEVVRQCHVAARKARGEARETRKHA